MGGAEVERLWERLLQEGCSGLFSTKSGAGCSYALSFFPPCEPLSSSLLPTSDLQGHCKPWTLTVSFSWFLVML